MANFTIEELSTVAIILDEEIKTIYSEETNVGARPISFVLLFDSKFHFYKKRSYILHLPNHTALHSVERIQLNVRRPFCVCRLINCQFGDRRNTESEKLMSVDNAIEIYSQRIFSMTKSGPSPRN